MDSPQAGIFYLLPDTQQDPYWQSIQACARFYGLMIQPLDKKALSPEAIVAKIEHSACRGLIVNGSILSSASISSPLLSCLEKFAKPCLFIDLPAPQVTVLSAQALRATAAMHEPTHTQLEFAAQETLLSTLSGLELAVTLHQFSGFTHHLDDAEVVSLLEVSSAEYLNTSIFLQAKQRFFLQCPEIVADEVWPITRFSPQQFVPSFAVLVFMRHIAGETAWHAPGWFANLTIDDPWLLDAYGHFDYARILEQMALANYHTTIAFVPWNYDRSERDAVEIVKANPQRFSVCVHGNNHNHREFYRYEAQPGDQEKPCSLAEQTAHIRQALRRMELFTAQTDIPYEPVMVFPHAIAPTETLAVLKSYNFLATANSGHVPLGAEPPSDPTFAFCNLSLDYANFASFNRFAPAPDPYAPKGRTLADIALDGFLQNPLLFFIHHEFYSEGPQAFNSYAQQVNQQIPEVRWVGLAEVARHAYRLRQAGPKNHYQVEVFSREIRLYNHSEQTRHYQIRKAENFQFPLSRVQLNGADYEYQATADAILVNLQLAPQAEALLSILYQSPELNDTVPNKASWRINLLRYLSDFRDLFVYTHPKGMAFIQAYYQVKARGGLAYFSLLGPALGMAGSAVKFIAQRVRLSRQNKYSSDFGVK